MDTNVLGVDIGGSHITAAQVSLRNKIMLDGTQSRDVVDSKASANQIIDVWTRVIAEAIKKNPMEHKKIGIAMPGPFDYELGIGLMKNQDKYDELYGLNVKFMLAEKLDMNPDAIRFTNDAACFLMGESFGGALRGYKKAIGITLGTGLGSSILNKGVVTDADLWCSPFLESITEDYLSTRWFTRRYHTQTGRQIKDVKELVDMAAYSNVAKNIFEEFGGHLGVFLNDFIEKTEPEAVVIGGNISHAYHLFSAGLHQALSENARQIPIRKAVLGETSALIGAASCWFHEESVLINS